MNRQAIAFGAAALAAIGCCATATADQVFVEEAGFNYVVEGLSLAVGDPAAAVNGVAIGDANLHSAVIGNRVEEAAGDRSATIDASLRGNAGLIGVNQNAGDVNNQANLRAFAIGGAVQNVDISGAVELRGNTLISGGGARQDLLNDSVAGGVGVVGVNQSAGSLNVQTNVVVLAVGAALGADALAMGDSALSAVVADNVREGADDGPRADTMAGGFQDFRGVVQVAQSAGDLNLVRNTLAVSVVATTLGAAP